MSLVSRRLFRVVPIIVTTSALTFLAPSSPASATCAPDLVTEGGTCAERIPTRPFTPFQIKQAKEKREYAAMIEKQLQQNGGTLRSTWTPDPGGGTVPPTKYVLPEIAEMRIYKEGEGNGRKSYTCGPSATRNVVAAMYRRKNGAYKDFGERQFEIWEKTTTAGTARANIATALNEHFSSFGSWRSYRPSGPSTLMSQIVTNTTKSRQAVIMNVDTEFLEYFNEKDLNHFNFVYGYSTASGNRVAFAEEWDPTYIYGYEPSYGNPYGRHWESLSAAFEAVAHTSYHGIVS